MTLQQLKELRAKMTQGKWEYQSSGRVWADDGSLIAETSSCVDDAQAIAALPDILDFYIALLEANVLQP